MKRLLQALVLGYALSGSVAAYDTNDNHITRESIDEVVKSTFKITAESESAKKKATIQGSAVAFMHEDGTTYFLTTYQIAHSFRHPENGDFLVTKRSLIHDGKEIPLLYERGDNKSHLAIVSAKVDVPIFARLARSEEIRIGDKMYGFGFAFNLSHSVSEGILTGIENEGYFTHAQLSQGSEGGPYVVFDKGVPHLVGVGISRVGALGTRPENTNTTLLSTPDQLGRLLKDFKQKREY